MAFKMSQEFLTVSFDIMVNYEMKELPVSTLWDQS